MTKLTHKRFIFRFKKYKIVDYGSVMCIVDKRYLKKTVSKHVNECCSMAAHLLMQLCKKDSMNDMLTSVGCLVLAFILLNIVRRVINTYLVWAVDLVVHHIRTSHATHVQGLCSLIENIDFHYKDEFVYFTGNCCYVELH